MNRYLQMFSVVMVMFILSQSCTYNNLSETDVAQTDESLFAEAISPDNFYYYREGTLLSAASASPHGSFKLRFNKIAWRALDSTEELPSGNVFPEGSIIVKEVYQGNSLYVLAVMKRTRDDGGPAMGWLWSEYFPDGEIAYGISKQGSGCVSCHRETPNRDLVRTFDLH